MINSRVLRALESYVSLKFAPSFVHVPESEAIGKSVRSLPENGVTAYVIPEVITKAEEEALLSLSSTWFKPLPFNGSHADGLIHHYKEFYRSYESLLNQSDIDKVAISGLKKARALALHYLPHIPVDDRVHFLQLEADGFIRAHVDETRNSSGLIGGLVLGSARVMTLTHPDHEGERVELLLAPRAFYAIIGSARYTWAHSVDWIQDDEQHLQRILKSGSESGKKIHFDGKQTDFSRGCRQAIIFRGVSPLHLLQHRMATGKTV